MKYNNHKIFKYNDYDDIDYGWGCAYRTTQTVLYAYLKLNNKILDCNNNIIEYNNKILDCNNIILDCNNNIIEYNNNKEKYLSINEIIEILNTKGNYLNIILEKGWLEPFDSYILFQKHFKFININLYFVSHNNFNTSKIQQRRWSNYELEKNQLSKYKCLNVKEFLKILNTHFNINKCEYPLIIDDSIYSYNILDYNDKEVIIGDPHIYMDTSLKSKNNISKIIYSISNEKFINMINKGCMIFHLF